MSTTPDDDGQDREGRLIIAVHRFGPSVDHSPAPPVGLTVAQWSDILMSLRRRGAHVVGLGGPLGDTIRSIEIQIEQGADGA